MTGRSLAVAAASLAVVACGQGSQAPQTYTRAQAQSHLVSAYLAYDQCARQHGLPNLPDAHVDDQGDDTYPPGSIPATGWPQSVIDGCAQAWANVRRWRDQLTPATPRPLTAAEINQSRQWAACMRTHGFPDFPDPGPDGRFHGQVAGYDKANLSPTAAAALAACNTPHWGS